MLSNLETEKSKLIQIVLVGQPDLHDMLNEPRARAAAAARHGQLPPARRSIPARRPPTSTTGLRKAAIGAPLVFPPEVTDLIGAASGGLPRKINVIADAVLLFGYGEDKRAIDAALVREVIAELDATGVLAEQRQPRRRTTADSREARLAPARTQPRPSSTGSSPNSTGSSSCANRSSRPPTARRAPPSGAEPDATRRPSRPAPPRRRSATRASGPACGRA